MSIRPLRRVLATTILLVAAASTQLLAQVGAPPAHDLDRDEYDVLAAVLADAHSPNSKGWIMLAARTATFECDPPPNNGFSMGGAAGCEPRASAQKTPWLPCVRRYLPSLPSWPRTSSTRANSQSPSRTLPLSNCRRRFTPPRQRTTLASKATPNSPRIRHVSASTPLALRRWSTLASSTGRIQRSPLVSTST